MTDKKKDWVSEVVGDGVKVEKADASVPTTPEVKTETAKDVSKETAKDVSLSQSKTKTKKVEEKKKGRTVKLFLDGKLDEYDIDEKLPEGFLMSKLKENQRYIPIHLYREIMRQIGEFWVPEFTDPEKFLSGKNKSNVDMVTYRVKCRVARNKPWVKEPIILTGVGYSSMSAWVLLSDAIHGNIATLEAKALRSALKHGYRCFEFPELDVETVEEKWVINEEKAKETIANVVKDMPKVESKTVDTTGIEKEITDCYNERRDIRFAQLGQIGEVVTKKHVLDLAKEIKEKFWEEHKSIISKIILNDFNSAK